MMSMLDGSDPTRLRGRVVVITGAAGGIGHVTSSMFAGEGAHVVMLDVDRAGAERRSQVLTDKGLSARAGFIDLADVSTINAAVDSILSTYGTIDVLCNVAGINDGLKTVHLQTDELWERVFAINVRGTFQLVRAALPSMLEAGSGIVTNVASVAGLHGGRSGAAYTASKHAVIGLTKNIAATYGRLGIRCNVVCPGSVETGMPLGAELDEQTSQRVTELRASMPRRARAEEIASVLTFLASDGASFLNGSTIVADGGWTAS